jgi:type IV pilus assembly protein PilB
MPEKLGEMLVRGGLVTMDQVEKALAAQKQNGGRLGSNLVKLGFVKEEQITHFLGQQFRLATVNLASVNIEPNVLKLVSAEVAQKYQVLPLSKIGRVLTLAMTNPADFPAIEDIKFLTGCEVQPVVAAETSVSKALERFFGVSDSSLTKIIDGMKGEDLEILESEKTQEEVEAASAEVEDAPVINLVNGLISDAVKRGASDIHIEPYRNLLRVRFRIDGVLQEIASPPARYANAVVSRLKIMASLKIDERRLPQDGAIRVKLGDRQVDLRVSTLPTIHGEKVVMRIQEGSAVALSLTSLGFGEKALTDFTAAISKPNGIVLVTGPTGSGKTNTLYAALAMLNTPKVNIVTAEDPVERDLSGVNQVHVKEDIGYTFAFALRAFLRQDPNIILVGEMRDKETAEIAIKSALTGHLVLSTVHTNNAASTPTRLVDMGVEPFLVASPLNLILAQRLVRKICFQCKEPYKTTPEVALRVGLTPEDLEGVILYHGKGCEDCNRTGYRGRIGIFEVMPIDPRIRQLIVARSMDSEIEAYAISQGMLTLRQDAIQKLKKGITTVDEVLRVTVE